MSMPDNPISHYGTYLANVAGALIREGIDEWQGAFDRTCGRLTACLNKKQFKGHIESNQGRWEMYTTYTCDGELTTDGRGNGQLRSGDDTIPFTLPAGITFLPRNPLYRVCAREPLYPNAECIELLNTLRFLILLRNDLYQPGVNARPNKRVQFDMPDINVTIAFNCA